MIGKTYRVKGKMTTIGTNIPQYEMPITTPSGTQSSGGVSSNVSIYSNTGATGSTSTGGAGSTSSTQQAPQTKRSINELKNMIASMLTKAGIDPDEAMKSGLLEKISGKNTEYLLNAEDNEIKQYIKYLELALKFSTKKSDGTADIDSVATIANRYSVALQSGWKEENLTKIFDMLAKAGINPNDAITGGLLERISGKNTEYLLKAPESEINKYIKCLELALKNAGKKADGTADMEKVGKLANDYHVLLQTGWSEDQLEKNVNGKSITSKLKEFYPNLDLNDKQAVREAAKKYITWVLDEAKIDTVKDRKKLQLQEFGKMLVNTPDEEKEIFLDVLEEMYHDNKLTGFESLMESIGSIKGRMAIADQAGDPERIIRLTSGVDDAGETMSAEQKTELVAAIASNQSETGLKTSHAKSEELKTQFENDHREELENIYSLIDGILKDNSLTPKEKDTKIKEVLSDELYKIWNEYSTHSSITAGQISGTANNAYIDEAFKTDQLFTLNSDAYQHMDYAEALKLVNEYFEEHKDELNIPIEEIEEALNVATNGNYGIVKEDVKNGTISELNPPTIKEPELPKEATVENPKTIGFENKNKTTTLTQTQEKVIEKTVEKDLQQARIEARKERRAGNDAKANRIMKTATKRAMGLYARSGYSFRETISKSGGTINDGIVFAYENEDTLPPMFVNKAKESFKDLRPKEQVKFIVEHGEKAYNFLKSELSPEAILELQNENVGSSTLKSAIESAAKVIEEQQN